MRQQDVDRIDRALAATLDDRRLSRGEKRALSEVLEDLEPNAHTYAFLRHRAFAVAYDALRNPNAKEVLGWLEDIVKLLVPKAAEEPIAEAWFSPGDNCPREIGRLIRRAAHTIDICVFTITDDQISDSILDAHQRGVAVRIITDDDKAFDRGSDIQRLARHGIPLRTDRSEDHMHNKFAIFDSCILLTGSYNWTRSAAKVNQENIAVTSEPRLVAAYRKEFERLWEGFG